MPTMSTPERGQRVTWRTLEGMSGERVPATPRLGGHVPCYDTDVVQILSQQDSEVEEERARNFLDAI